MRRQRPVPSPFDTSVSHLFYRWIVISAALLPVLLIVGCAGVSNSTRPGSPDPSLPAAISTQPTSQSAAVGQTVTFTVGATGSAPLTYQWRKNSSNISGGSTSSYTTPAIVAADDGSKFDVVVSNSMGSVTSSAATLSVTATAKPAITTQPANQTVSSGQSATFSVVATGTPAPTYQWRKNSSNIGGATSATYKTPATSSTDNGAKFDVIVSNSAGSVTSNAATLAVNSGAAAKPAITTQPSNQTVTVGQKATFTVAATGSPAPTYQWQKDGANISGATSASYVTPATVAGDSGTKFAVVVSNSAGKVTSNSATLTVNSAPASNSTVDVTTYHYDNLRTGQNTHETTLTHANVTQSKFGKVGSFPVDGKVDGQPLYLSNVAIPGKGTKNVLYVVTEHDTVFAFDADSINNGGSAVKLWSHSVLQSGETTSDDRGCGQVTPEIGITSTPVIDRSRNAIYVVSVSRTSGNDYIHRIHALNLTTGAELFGGPKEVDASFQGSGAGSSNGKVNFEASQYNERAGLLQIGSTIYTTWTSHCDHDPYTSWVISYSADDLSQRSVLNLVPNGAEGGIWMAGTAPAADSSGNIYFIVGNGDFGETLDSNGFPANHNCGNCFVKISSTPPMKLLDYFATFNTTSQSNADTDFGSGGPLLLPDMTDSTGKTRHLTVGSGKDRAIFVLDRDNMGKFNSSKNNVYQQIDNGLSGGVWAKPSYFNGVVYYGAVGDSIKAFPVSSAKLAGSSSSHSSESFGYPGSTPSISADGNSDGIVWAVETHRDGSSGKTFGVLHAYDAGNLGNELYHSSLTPGASDSFSNNKYITPVVANGKVFVGTQNSVVAFGLK